MRPPVVSTQAPNGMRSSDPVRDGMATRTPSSVGLSPIRSLIAFAVGPNKDTAAKPKKNPSVAPHRPCPGEPHTFPGAEMAGEFMSSPFRLQLLRGGDTSHPALGSRTSLRSRYHTTRWYGRAM